MPWKQTAFQSMINSHVNVKLDSKVMVENVSIEMSVAKISQFVAKTLCALIISVHMHVNAMRDSWTVMNM